MGTAFTYQGRLMDADHPAEGQYDFEFMLYDAPSYGNQMQSKIDINDLNVIDGYFTVELDFTSSVFDGNSVWLEIGVRPGDSNDPNAFITLRPRQKVTPTPYALYAKTTENAIIGSGTTNRIAKFTGPNTLGDSALYEDNYYVGVGTASPRGMFDVDCDGGDIYLDTFSAKIYIGDVDGDGDETLFTVHDGGKFTFENGSVGIGTASPQEDLHIYDAAGHTYVRAESENGYAFFIADGSYNSGLTLKENGTTKANVYWNTANDSLSLAEAGVERLVVKGDKVGIGTTTPRASLEVTNSGNSRAIWVSTSDIPVYAQRTSTSGTWPAVNGDCNSESSGASGVRGRILSTSPGSLSAGVYGYNYGTGGNGAGVRGHHAGNGYGVYGDTAGHGAGVYGENSVSGNYGYLGGGQDGVHGYSSSGNDGVSGISSSGNGVSGTSSEVGSRGVYGYSNNGTGVYGCSTSGHGVRGYSNSGYGVYGEHSSGSYGYLGGGPVGVQVGVHGRYYTGNNYGYIGGPTYGVYGYSLSGQGVCGSTTSGLAGYFIGNVEVTGNLTKSTGSFKIDHPLDPENKYLYHSFIESPDMMNVYNGNVTLDKNGEAVVELADYFDALNRDFRYQLTCIGGFAPVYVAEEISENKFKIAGGKRGMKVSWQVTGIRQDAYAKANPIVVEENKSIEERGYYLHPTAYGLPEEKAIESLHNPRLSEARQVAKEESR
jgi:hypothetical protein